MTDNPRLRQLLDELHESHATPEEVCRSCPELLPEVRARWRAVCRVRAELDALFPAPTARGVGAPALLPASAPCHRSLATTWRRSSATAAWASSTGRGTCAFVDASP
jgi:hypothetical protein